MKTRATVILASCVWLALLVISDAGPLRDRFPELVKADPEPSRTFSGAGVRITYLGTNGYLLEAHDAVVLIDPYFSRMSLARCALKLATVAEPERVDRWLARVPRIDTVLVTHGHVDHLFDVPQILRHSGAALYASSLAVTLVGSAGVPARQLHSVRPGAVRRIGGGVTIRVLHATHDRVLGSVPNPDPPKHLPPQQVDDWTVGEPLAFLIEIGGKRIYLNSGSLPWDVPPTDLGRIDLAILGVATPDAIRAFPIALRQLRPALVLPSHQDDFFRSLDEGFHFLPGTNFHRVLCSAQAQHRPLVLLDYFQPWTLR